MNLTKIERFVRKLTRSGSQSRPLPRQGRWSSDQLEAAPDPEAIPDDHFYADMERRVLAYDDRLHSNFDIHGSATGRLPRQEEHLMPNGRDHLTNAEAVYLQGVNRLRAELQEARDNLAITNAENAALTARCDVYGEMLATKTADCDRWQMLATELTVNLNTAQGILAGVFEKAQQEAKKLPARANITEVVEREIERRRSTSPPSAPVPEPPPQAAIDGQSEEDDGKPPPSFLLGQEKETNSDAVPPAPRKGRVERSPGPQWPAPKEEHPIEPGRTDRT